MLLRACQDWGKAEVERHGLLRVYLGCDVVSSLQSVLFPEGLTTRNGLLRVEQGIALSERDCA